MTEYLLQTKGLTKTYPIKGGSLGIKRIGIVKAVDGVHVEIHHKQNYAIVGESGCGKTTLGKAVIRVLEPSSGEIWFDGREISKLKGEPLKRFRAICQMVYQDPSSSLNPRRRVKDIITAPLHIHKVCSRTQQRERVKELLNLVELPSDYMYRYPSALSGGEKQRVGIARAIALHPRFIVLDEPTSSLDVSVQAKVLRLLKRLQAEFELTYLLITHDLGVVRNFSERVAVMYLGKLVEIAPTEAFFGDHLHPYSKALLSATPVVSEQERRIMPKRITLTGEVPSPSNLPTGCRFHTRCPQFIGDICRQKEPELLNVKEDHLVRCHLY